MSSSREVDNETMSGVNFRFAVVTEEEIFQMQKYSIPKKTKKATKLGMKVFRGKQCKQFANMSSALLVTAFSSILIAKLRRYLSP